MVFAAYSTLELAPPREADHPLARTVPGGLYTRVLQNTVISEQQIIFLAAQELGALGVAIIFEKMGAILGFVEARGGRSGLSIARSK